MVTTAHANELVLEILLIESYATELSQQQINSNDCTIGYVYKWETKLKGWNIEPVAEKLCVQFGSELQPHLLLSFPILQQK